MLNLCKAAGAITLLPILCASSLPGTRTLHNLNRKMVQGSAANGAKTWTSESNLGAFVRRVTGETTACVEASSAQTHDLRNRSTESLTNVTIPRPAIPQSGLRIILRGTPQLQNFFEAVAAFNRAATLWELRIQTVETIVIDVDFGPTLFGSPFDDDIVAAVDSQTILGNALYTAARDRLVHGPYDPARRSFYVSLPVQSIPTDLGPAPGIAATSASLRALDLINTTADPDTEAADLGPPPAIAINSRFAMDFNPGDGIDPDKLDFEAIVLHSIGHALGFVSSVGEQEMSPSTEVQPSLWDMFRVRPDATTADFSSIERVLSPGGAQVFFAGGAMQALSTARPDGAGGDGRHPSHWKDDSLTNSYTGIMDPTIAVGERQFITDDDLSALSAIGYRTISIADPTTVVSLHPSTPAPGWIIAPPTGFGVLSHLQYSIVVPAGATELKIDLSGNQDVDLFVRFGRPVVNQGHAVIADYRAATDSNSETLTLTPSSSPPLNEGIYYLAVANFGPGDADFTITATVTGGAVGHAPAVFNIVSQLDGDLLTVDCSAADFDADLSAAEVMLLDEAGDPVGSVSILEFAGAASPRSEFRVRIAGMGLIPTARMVNVVLADQTGNRSADASVDFGKAEFGALTLSNGSFGGSKLKLKVRGPASNLSVEINGRIVPPSQKIKLNDAGTKLTVKGSAVDLGLREGPNRVRVQNSNGWSNILVVFI